MCDTLFAAARITRDNRTLFAKNSDRPPNEAQHLSWFPAQKYKKGTRLSCTYIDIPQAEETAAILLSKPFWMWGAEMGVNEHGVVIGNEAVFSKNPANKEPALLGMDLLRLGLERGRTALEALEVISGLLEEFGQGGNCIQNGHLYYHNSYLITDPNETWVLETNDRHWAARKVAPFYSISNLISLEESWDRSSTDLRDFLLKKGLSKTAETINLTNDLSDFIYTTFSDGGSRCRRSRELLSQHQGEITIQTMASILRDHQDRTDPTTGISGASICMHAGFGPIRVSQTTASMIVSLGDSTPLVFATGTAAPCTGIFVPVWLDAAPSLPGFDPAGFYDPETIFWAHERLHRNVMLNYPEKIAVYQSARNALEEEFIIGALELNDKNVEARKAYSEECFRKASEALESWLSEVKKIPSRSSFIHTTAWRGFNKRARFPS